MKVFYSVVPYTDRDGDSWSLVIEDDPPAMRVKGVYESKEGADDMAALLNAQEDAVELLMKQEGMTRAPNKCCDGSGWAWHVWARGFGNPGNGYRVCQVCNANESKEYPLSEPPAGWTAAKAVDFIG